MAHTARSGDEKKEYFDSPEELDRKVALVAGWIRDSKANIAFTGAGISTAAGIPDFRSGMKTCLTTGPGVWELRAHKQSRSTKAKTIGSTLKAIPTPTHMMLCALEERGLLHHLVSQNTDGLHRRSAFPPSKLSELHGNSNMEICGGRAIKKGGKPMKGCGREFLRDFKARARGLSVFDHRTGRKCPFCKCDLHDSIINFGENLPEKAIEDGFEWGDKAEVCLAMGSSLTVTPAADIPLNVTKRSRARGGKAGRLVIVNLQKTPLDSHASLVVHAKCEEFSAKLAEALKVEVPPFRLHRYLRVRAGERLRSGGVGVSVSGEDVDGTPFELVSDFKAVEGKGRTLSIARGDTGGANAEVAASGETTFRLEFMGHYKELPLQLTINGARALEASSKAGASDASRGAAAGGGGGGSSDAVPESKADPARGDSEGGSSAPVSDVVLRCSFDPKAGEWVGVAPTGGDAMPAWLKVKAETRKALAGASGAATGGGGGAALRKAPAGASARAAAPSVST